MKCLGTTGTQRTKPFLTWDLPIRCRDQYHWLDTICGQGDQVLSRFCFLPLLTEGGLTVLSEEEGKVHPVTVIQTGPATVTQVKTDEKDGYNAIQVGFGVRKEKNLTKAFLGHTKGQPFQFVREYRQATPIEGIAAGDTIELSAFEVGDVVTTTSTSKGKGSFKPA